MRWSMFVAVNNYTSGTNSHYIAELFKSHTVTHLQMPERLIEKNLKKGQKRHFAPVNKINSSLHKFLC